MIIGYQDVLDGIHRAVLPRTYLEIGVQHGYTLQLTLPCTAAVGVDPLPTLLAALPGNVRVETMTSDDYFDDGHAARDFGSDPIDVAFIDGMHQFEFALRDFCNVERLSRPEAVVILDDCLPRTSEEASRERTSVEWAGDVWRVIECLRVERPDLDITFVRAAPTGLAVIRNLDPTSDAIDPLDPALLERYLAVGWERFVDETLSTIDSVEARWELIEPLLPAPMQDVGDVEALVRERDQTPVDVRARLRRIRYWVLHTAVGVRLNSLRRSIMRR